MNKLNTEIKLPCGVNLKNRLVKSAMTERISNGRLEPTKGHEVLYRLWANSGAGLLITGNVFADRNHLESSGNVCFDNEEMLPKLKLWANSAKGKGAHVWTQLSHAGRQTNRFVNRHPLSASGVQLKKTGLFASPKAMTEEDIQLVIQGFVKMAKLSKEAGFTGVQIHSAHGYLLSQFLSPITNKREDQWGGDIENRSRLLKSIVAEIRKEVGPEFPIAVKLNSSDFQRGGFTEEESLEVIKMLEKEGIDLLEISGGTYEKVVFFLLNEEHKGLKESTIKREAYFIDFAKKVREVSSIPLLITGGFRSFDFCNEVLENGELDLIGMARPFISNIDEIPAFINGEVKSVDNIIVRSGIRRFEDAAEGGYYARQIIRLSKGKRFNLKLSPFFSSIFLVYYEFIMAMRNKLCRLF